MCVIYFVGRYNKKGVKQSTNTESVIKTGVSITMAIVTFRGLALHRKKNSEKLFECTRKNDEWQIWRRAFISEKNKWKQNEKRFNTHLQYLGLSTDR